VKRVELAALVAFAAMLGGASTFNNTVPQAAVGTVVMATTAAAIVWTAERRGWVPKL
jgi:hypothetical protein